MRIHIVQKGDTLWKIAKEYGISFEDLKRLNAHLANPDYIVPGMEIILPEKINKETHKETHKETQVHKEMPTTQTRPSKESVKKEVQKPMPAPPPIVVQPPAPMPMPEPQMIPIPFPMPMPMPMPMPQPQQPMWVPQPVELSWNQQLVMPQQPAPIPAPPVAQPAPPPPPPPPPAPAPAPPVQHVPHMPMVPHCSSCHQPVHHQMWWHMPMQPQIEAYTMPQQSMPCAMPQQPMHCAVPANAVGGENFLESSTSPFFNPNAGQMQPQFEQMPMMPMMPMNQSCGCGTQHGMGQSCGCGSQPVMMPNWQFDPCHCPPPCSAGPWMSPHFFPGGMTPYRW